MLIMSILAGMMLAVAACVKSPCNFPPDDTSVKIDSTNLPIVWIEVGGDSIMRDQRIDAHMKIVHNGDGHLNYADTIAHRGQHIDYDGYIAVRHRGNSTYISSPKKPYSLRTLSEPLKQGGKKKKVSLLGLGKDNDWVLLAPYADKSMIRDQLTRELSQPWMELTPQGRFCELYLDGIYYGVHVLSEAVSKGKHRLALNRPGEDGDALTGDYLLEVDCNDETTYTSKHHPVTTDGKPIANHRIQFQYKYPHIDDLSEAQLDYIHRRIDDMENSFETGNYAKYIDVASFIDYQLMMELCHNVDAYRLSGKFYKRRDSVDPRFKMVVWDTDLAYGNADHRQAWRIDTWMYENNDIMLNENEVYMVPTWWYWLNHDARYTSSLKRRWAELRATHLSTQRVMATVDSLAALLTTQRAEQRNSRAWPRWGVHVWPNHYDADSYTDEIAYIKRWLTERIAWMDSQLKQ